jgi:hypothetical protein
MEIKSAVGEFGRLGPRLIFALFVMLRPHVPLGWFDAPLVTAVS